MTQPDPTTAPDLLPEFRHKFYGRPSDIYQENEAIIVVGHDHRSWAALNAVHRHSFGVGPISSRLVTRSWVRFVVACGCTPGQYAGHAEDGCYGYQCTYPGLPPCTTDELAWFVIRVKQTTPGAVPALEYWL